MRPILYTRDARIAIIKLHSELSSFEIGEIILDYIYDVGHKLGTMGLDYLAIRDEELNENQ